MPASYALAPLSAQASSRTTPVGKIGKSAVATVSVAALAEESDTYAHVVVRLNNQWRVISLRDGIQWALQIRGGRRWRNRYFFRTREALIRFAREHARPLGGEALVVLLRLPDRFPEAAP
jgi:hypothetical protein